MLFCLDNELESNTVTLGKEQKKGHDIFACRVRCQLKLAGAQFTIVSSVQDSRVVPFTSCLNSTYYLDSSSLSLLEERCRSVRQIRLERIYSPHPCGSPFRPSRTARCSKHAPAFLWTSRSDGPEGVELMDEWNSGADTTNRQDGRFADCGAIPEGWVTGM